MLPTNSHSTRKRHRLTYATIVLVAFMLIASPGLATTSKSEPQALQAPQATSGPAAPTAPNAPDATCPSDGQCFADVPSGNTFYEFVNRIYQQDLVSGYPCGGAGEPCDAENRPYYRPGGLVTRQQMAKFIDNARRLPQIYIAADSTEPLILAVNQSGPGIRGDSYSNSNNGVSGTHWGEGRGVYGQSISGGGVSGYSASGCGVCGSTISGWAGYFNGNVEVTGSCCGAGAGSFKIDHPLDPENKYLNQSLVQSPDMTTVINGNTTLDAKGEATVALPSWFEAANRDYRYTLTPIGAPGPNLYISKELERDQFTIAGGKARAKVSWQITGIRQDPYATAHRIPVEEEKPADEKGKYLHPVEYGQPASSGIGYEEQQMMQVQMQQEEAR